MSSPDLDEEVPVGVPASPSVALRWSNAHAVLTSLRSSGPATATDLVLRTQLSRPTVHAVCGELIRLGWVEELDPIRPMGPGRPGRSARLYRFRSDAAYVVGVDLGAHTVDVAVADLDGTTVVEQRRAHRDPLVGAQERLATTRACLEDALASEGLDQQQVLAATIGVPGPVDRERGATTAHESFLPGLDGLDLRRALDLPGQWAVEVENDCNLAALGERWRGVAADADDVIVLLAGERLGAGVVMDGRLVRGRSGAAGEMSYLFLCEGVGSADGIAAVARQLGERAAAGGWEAGGQVDAEAVFTAAAADDPVALQLVDELGARFARVAASLDLLFDPEVLVFAGGAAVAGDVFLPAILRHIPAAYERMCAPPLRTLPRIAASSLGEHVVVTGAVRLALDAVDARDLGADGDALRPAPGVRDAA